MLRVSSLSPPTHTFVVPFFYRIIAASSPLDDDLTSVLTQSQKSNHENGLRVMAVVFYPLSFLLLFFFVSFSYFHRLFRLRPEHLCILFFFMIVFLVLLFLRFLPCAQFTFTATFHGDDKEDCLEYSLQYNIHDFFICSDFYYLDFFRMKIV